MPRSGSKSATKPRRAKRSRSKPAIAIVGAGRLGTALGIALSEIGYRVEIVVAKRPTNARRAAKLIGKGTVGLAASQLLNNNSRPGRDRLRRCKLIIVSTPDDAISKVARQLEKSFNSRAVKSKSAPRITLHTSGALSSSVLSPLRRAGIAIGSLHPLVSISDARTGVAAFRNAFFAVEGDRPATRVARSLVKDLGGQSISIAPSAKPLYHAAAVTASGHMTALYDIALEMLARSGLSPRRAQQVLWPLLDSTAKNLAKETPRQALTGTFARGDISTAERHLAAIKSANLPDALAAYVLLGQRSLRLTRENGTRDEFDQIARLLSAAAQSSSRRR